jgi:hypothetical protein
MQKKSNDLTTTNPSESQKQLHVLLKGLQVLLHTTGSLYSRFIPIYNLNLSNILNINQNQEHILRHCIIISRAVN